MELQLSFYDFAVVFFASGAIILSTMAVSILIVGAPKRSNPPADRWLALLLLVAAAFLGTQIINFGGFQAINPAYYYPPLRFTFSLGPLLYFYIRQLASPARSWRPIDSVHFILPLFQAALTLWLAMQTPAVKDQFWIRIDQGGYGFFDELWTALSMVGYALVSWRIIKSAQSGARQGDGDLQRGRHFLVVFLACGIIALFIDAVVPRAVWALWRLNLHRFAAYNSLPVIFYSLGLLWGAGHRVLKDRQIEPPNTRKETYGIETAQIKQYQQQIEQHMVTAKPHLDSNLTLSKFARQLDLPPRHLSYIINESFGQSFNEFINSFRIREACNQLANPQNDHRSVLDIAYATGFNSKSTFNRLFRQQTGKTPSQLRADSRVKSS